MGGPRHRLPTDGMFRDLFAMGRRLPPSPQRDAADRRRNKFRWDWHLRNFLMACMPAGAAWLSALWLERFYNSEEMQRIVREAREQRRLLGEEGSLARPPSSPNVGMVESVSAAVEPQMDLMRRELATLRNDLRGFRQELDQAKHEPGPELTPATPLKPARDPKIGPEVNLVRPVEPRVASKPEPERVLKEVEEQEKDIRIDRAKQSLQPLFETAQSQRSQLPPPPPAGPGGNVKGSSSGVAAHSVFEGPGMRAIRARIFRRP